jgi:hypothetical protein
MNIIDYNLQSNPQCTKVIVPSWHSIQEWNHPGVELLTHELYFVEYQDSSGNVLMRHTLSVE